MEEFEVAELGYGVCFVDLVMRLRRSLFALGYRWDIFEAVQSFCKLSISYDQSLLRVPEVDVSNDSRYCRW